MLKRRQPAAAMAPPTTRPLELGLDGTWPKGFGDEYRFAFCVGFTICRITLSQAFFQKLVSSSERRIGA